MKPTWPRPIDDTYRQDMRSRSHQTSWNFVTPRGLPAVRTANLNTVEKGHIVVIDHTHGEHQVLVVPCFGDCDRHAMPEDSINTIFNTKCVDMARNLSAKPLAVVHSCIRVRRWVRIECLTGLVPSFRPITTAWCIAVECLWSHPCFNTTAAPTCIDQANRNIQLIM